MILAWLTGNFRLITRIIGGVVGIALLVFGYWFFSSDMKARRGWKVAKAQVAHLDSVVRSQAKQIAHRDTLITAFKQQRDEAVQAGREWQNQYSNQVAVSDATADKLTDVQAKLAFYNASVKNGTLRRTGKPDSLTNERPLIRAGLKTATRLVVATGKLDTLSLALAYGEVANRRLRAGLKQAGNSMRTVAGFARSKVHGGMWPFNHKRRKQLRALADSLDVRAVEVENTSALENELNPK